MHGDADFNLLSDDYVLMADACRATNSTRLRIARSHWGFANHVALQNEWWKVPLCALEGRK